MRRRKTDSIEVQQMKLQAKEEREMKEVEKWALFLSVATLTDCKS